jgi:hypothetical protein
MVINYFYNLTVFRFASVVVSGLMVGIREKPKLVCWRGCVVCLNAAPAYNYMLYCHASEVSFAATRSHVYLE